MIEMTQGTTKIFVQEGMQKEMEKRGYKVKAEKAKPEPKDIKTEVKADGKV